MFLTASKAASHIRGVIKDYNFWGQSESDSPLKISTTKAVIDNEKILSLDRSLRTKNAGVAPTKEFLETRTVVQKNLDEVFKPLALNAIEALNDQGELLDAGTANLESLAMEAESVEYYVQLYAAFKQVTNPKIYYVDAPADPSVGMFIVGTVGTDTVYASALLTQT